jgi:hypothetical protein
MMRQMQESLDETCPFCRKPAPTEKDVEGYAMKRIEANDPNEMQQQGSEKYDEGDYSSAFEYFTKAARLGDVLAHYGLAGCYRLGHGVEKDKKKKCTIGNKLPLVVIPSRGTILGSLSGTMVRSREQ